MLYRNDEFPWYTVIATAIVLAMLLFILFVYASGFVRSWIARRAMLVFSYDDEYISIPDSVPARYS